MRFRRRTKARSQAPRIPDFSGLSVDGLFSGLDFFNLGIGVCNRRLRVEGVNRTLAAIHNLPQRAHPGKTLSEVMGPLSEVIGSNCEHVFSTGQPMAHIQQIGKVPGCPGVGCWIDYYFPIEDSRGRVILVAGLVMEVQPGPLLQRPSDSALNLVVGKDPGGYLETRRSDEWRDAQTSKPRPQAAVLSAREHDVLRFLALGKSNAEISAILGLSVKTVETHRSRVMLKIGASSLVHLVHYAIRHQIVEPQG